MSEKEQFVRTTATRFYKAKTREGRMAIRKSFFDQLGESKTASMLWEMISFREIEPEQEIKILNCRNQIEFRRKTSKKGPKARKIIVTLNSGNEISYKSVREYAEDSGYTILHIYRVLSRGSKSINIRYAGARS